MGGVSAAQEPLERIESSPILSDGSLGPFVTLPDRLIGGRYEHGAGVGDGWLYVAGGINDAGTVLQDVQRAAVSRPATLGDWQLQANRFAGARSYLASAVSGDFVYVAGGLGGGLFGDVQVARVAADGTIGPWAVTRPLPSARGSFPMVAHRGYLYVLAGYTGGLADDVYSAPIGVDGQLGPWVLSPNRLPARFNHTANVWGDRLYVTGGCVMGECDAVSDQVWVATLGPGGTVGPWVESASHFGAARYDHSAEIYGHSLYVIAGRGADPLQPIFGDVQVAAINADGTLGPFRATESMAHRRFTHITAAADGYLYVVGGAAWGFRFMAMERAPIRADGTLGPWSMVGPHYVGGFRGGAAPALIRGTLYLLGGDEVMPGQYADSAISIRLTAPQQPMGRYTGYVDFDAPTSGQVLQVLGDAARKGTVRGSFRVSTDGGVYGAATVIDGGMLNALTSLHLSNATSVALSLTLDDSAAPVDDEAGRRDVTEIVINADGGASHPHRVYDVGCACGSSPLSAALLGACVLLLRVGLRTRRRWRAPDA
jgi:hypothetical protein